MKVVRKVFTGEFDHNVDKKGRMCIPVKFREDLGEKFMICKGLDGNACLYIYPMSEWQKLDEKIQSMPVIKSRQLQRFIYPGASEVECDSQGRILIPAKLREYAGLESTVTVVGVSHRAEVWNTESWKSVADECTPQNIVNSLEELDF